MAGADAKHTLDAERPNASHGTPVRTYLIALIAVLLVPFVIYAAVLLREYADAQRARSESYALEMARRIAAMVDRDLAGLEGMLQAVALSPAVLAMDAEAAYDELARVGAAAGVQVALKDRDGVQIVNTAQPRGTIVEATRTEPDEVALATRLASVSNLLQGRSAGRLVVQISVPVLRGDEVIGFVGTGMFPERFARLIETAGVSGEWSASIIDANNLYIARTQRDEMIGTPGPIDFAGMRDGVARGRNTRGVTALAAFAPSSLAPWRIGVGVPEDVIMAPLRRSLAMLIGAGVLALGLAAALGGLFARRLARPMRALASSAAALAHSGAARHVDSDIAEVAAISDALVSSAAVLAIANQQRDQAEGELRGLADSLDNQVKERTASLERAHNQLLTEVGERERIEDKLRQSQKMEAIGQLTGGVAHDFNNLLMVILSSLQMAQRRIERGDTSAVRRNLDHALTAVSRAASLTHRLLAFSRQQPLQPVAMEPGKLVSGMAELLRRSLGENMRIETDAGSGVWAIHADQSQLENAILNLALNARDAMPEGGTITIATRNVTLDEGYAAANPGSVAGDAVVIMLTDTGSGMTPEVLARAFDPFFTTKPHGAGTGLGLSQVYGFIRQSGGHVRILSKPGRGTTVEMVLPRFHGPVLVHDARTAAPRTIHPTAQGTILLVEDDDAVRAVNGDTLRELGYTVLEAGTAAEALRLLDARAHVDLLFTDVVMPEINGRQLAEEALRRRPGLRVLFATGYAPDAAMHHGVLEPGVELLSKPFSVEELADRLRKILREAEVA